MTGMMKHIIILVLTTLTLTAFSQQPERISHPSNSFEQEYHTSNPTLIYSYDSLLQIHNYSSNWDFDHDGILDGFYFMGTGGAHLYYFLRIILSADKTIRDFHFAQTDFPYLLGNEPPDMEKVVSGFIVTNIGKDLKPRIIVRLDDNTFYAFKKDLSKLRIKTKIIAIGFENGKTTFGCL